MAAHSYPTSLAEITTWANARRASVREANVRFAEYVILSCLADEPVSRRSFVFKGGNSLRFAHQSPRSTKDLDFTVADNAPVSDVPEQLRGVLDRALGRAHRRFGVKLRCQRVRRNPPGPNATHPTYDVRVGYQFPDDRYFHGFENRDVSTVIPLEISFGDLVCESEPLSLAGAHSGQIQVCTLDDIVAEKLRALLQQPLRHRNRPQDVYDVARCCRELAEALDLAKVGDYLKRKSAIREIAARKSSFNNDVRDAAALDYDRYIQARTQSDFISFEEAWNEVLSLVRTLEIPD